MKTCIGNLIQINIKSHGFIYNVSTESNRPFIHSIRNMEIAIDSKTNAKEFVEKIQWGRGRYSSWKTFATEAKASSNRVYHRIKREVTMLYAI